MWEPVRYTARPARCPEVTVKYRGFLADTVSGPVTVSEAALMRDSSSSLGRANLPPTRLAGRNVPAEAATACVAH